LRVAALAWLVALHAPQPALADELGRLFHTPEERKALDAARTRSVQPQKPAGQPVASLARAPLEGFVVRSDGLSTLWREGRAVRVPAKAR